MNSGGNWDIDFNKREKTNTQYMNSISKALFDGFSVFKSEKHYNQIVGCDSHGEEKANYIANYIKNRYEWIAEDINKYKINDACGNPPIYDTVLGIFSPNTLMYILHVGHIKKMLGGLDNKIIVEIGSGYGGQAVVFGQEYKWNKYIMIDIPLAIELHKKYINLFPGLKNINYQTSKDINSVSSDVVISNFAFTELNELGMTYYVNSFFKKTKSFYIQSNANKNKRNNLFNILSNLFDIYSYTEDGISEILIGVKK